MILMKINNYLYLRSIKIRVSCKYEQEYVSLYKIDMYQYENRTML